MTRWLSGTVLLLALAPVAAAEPLVKRNLAHYEVGGETAKDIRAEMDRLGPISQTTNRRFDATTRWYVKWTYRYRNVGQDCAIARVSVTVDIDITMPRLKEDSSAALARAFNEFSEKLLAHEEGHAQTGIEIGKRIEVAIRDMPPQQTCDALGHAANALGDRLIKEGNQMDVEYDARTQHGRTQGARFP
jgi:predicted secreted Zn-dependent protease